MQESIGRIQNLEFGIIPAGFCLLIFGLWTAKR